ncbi:hypothetical protein WJX74_000450 [Apatococcus lobatus]|uniref:DUF3054 domain-containing protein n=1 Tax=Apatococcus lobatus TaxID=904363 RepID=A0AAW1QCC1_9CHLO
MQPSCLPRPQSSLSRIASLQHSCPGLHWVCKPLKRSTLHAQATPDSKPSNTPSEAPAAPQINPRTGRPSGIKLQRVERLGKESWAGVADVDRGTPQTPSLGFRAALLAGDVGVLLLFAAIGRSGHGEGLSPPELLSTAWPFITGWCISAGLQGSYSSQPPASPAAAAGAAAKVWLAGIPAGIVLRSASKGYVPDKSFVIVTLLATAALLLGWRATFSALGPKTNDGSKKSTKRGNPLEFFQLLSSLTRRW